MDRLKIIDKSAFDLGDQFGIPPDRREFLSTMLNVMVVTARTGDLRLFYVSDILNYIREKCSTEEEFTWCLMLHMHWMFRTGRMIRPFIRK